MTKRSKWILVGAGAVLAGAVPLPAQVARYRSSDTRIPVSKEPVPMPTWSAPVHISVKGSDTTIKIKPRMPIPAFRLVDYLGFSEPQVAWFMSTRDSVQIATAQLVQQKATNPQVRQFAATVEHLRSVRLADTWDAVRRGPKDETENVHSEPRGNDYELARRVDLFQRLSKMQSGPDFDAAYLQTQFFLDQNEIDVLTANHDIVRDNDFRKLVNRSMKELGQERDTARDIAQALKVNIP
jgi:predicted outer membrane protein